MAASTVFSSGFAPILYAQVSDKIRLLTAAASKAEEAASRYETHTAGPFQANNPLLRREVAESPDASVICHLPLNASPTALNKPEPYPGRDRGDSMQKNFKASSGGTESLAHQMSSSLNPEACNEISQDDSLVPPLHTKMSSNGESPSNKPVFNLETQTNPAFVSSTRLNKSQSPPSGASASDPLGQATSVTAEEVQIRKSIGCSPLIDKLVDQRRQHKIPKPVVEWMNGEKLMASEFTTLTPSRSEPDKAKAVRKPQSSHPQTSTAYQPTKEAFDAPRQTSTARPTHSPISIAVETTGHPKKESDFQNLGQSTTANPNTLPLHLADDLAFAQFFKNTIYTSIKASETDYQGRLPEDILRLIGKSVSDYTNLSAGLKRFGELTSRQVANQVVTQSLRNLVRECSYKLNDEQNKKIRKSIKSLYDEKAAGSIARMSLANRQKTSDRRLPKTVSNEAKGLSNTLSTDTSSRTFASHSLSSARSSFSANSFVGRKEAIPDESRENPADGFENLVNISHSPPQSPTRMLGSAKASSDIATVENPRLSPCSLKDGLPGSPKQLILPGAKVPSAVDSSVVSTMRQYVSGQMKLPDRATEDEPSRSNLQYTTKSEIEDNNLPCNQPCNQQATLIDAEKAVEQKHDPGNLSGKTEKVPNHLVNITSTQPNLEKQLSVDLKLRPDHNKSSLATLCLHIDLSSEEDGDQVLATWLKAKPSKEISDQKMPNRSIEDYFVPRSSREGSSSVGTRSSPTTSFNTVAQKTRSLQSSHVEDFSIISSKPKQYSLPREHSKLSRSALLTEASGSVVSQSDFDPIPSKEAAGCSATNGLSQRQEGRPQREEGSSQRHERTSPHHRRPLQFQTRSSRHSKGSIPSATSTTPPVIVGRPLKQDDPELVKNLAELALRQTSQRRPYSSKKRVRDYSQEESTKVKHVDFSEEECKELMQAWLVLDSPKASRPKLGLSPNFRSELQESLQTASPAEMTNFIQHLDGRLVDILPGRSSRAIKAFLRDLVAGRVPNHPKCIRVELQHIDPCHHPLRTTASLLRQRELGIISGRGFRNVRTELQLRTSQKISPWRSWKGASGDIVACAWAPSLESSTFAVGAAAHTNEEDLQYNRPRNLLLGNLISNTLEELPDHRISRPRPDTISRGPNSNQAVYDACDPMVYTTVSSLHFSGDGSRLYSASHDATVKIWDVPSSSCIDTLRHKALVSDLDVSHYFRNVFAAATKTIADSIHVYFPESDDSTDSRLSSVQFHSPRAKSGRKGTLFPGCLRWGRTLNTSRLLLAGFQQWGADCDSRAEAGETCLWDVRAGESLKVSPGSQSVFAATWHPTLDLFATGGSPSRSRPLTHGSTKSVVRTWDVRNLARYAMEYECPAMDMQDVTFNPYYPNIVTAGCSDSATYVWDFRKPDYYLHRLQHGRPLLDWDHTKAQEEGDPGVMMTVWGMEGARLYTGSSDGIVKSWDVMRAPDDVHIGDIGDLGAGVQSGAFSPDFSHLLVGDSDGGVHILSSAPVAGWAETGDEGRVQPIDFIQARDVPRTAAEEDNPGTEGIEAAQELLDSGRVVFDARFGVGQGPNYRGPYARHARAQAEEARSLLPEFEALQPFSNGGRENLAISRTRQNLMEERRRLIAERREEPGRDDGDSVVKYDSDAEPFPSGRSIPSQHKRDREEHSRSPRRKKRTWAIVDLCTPPPGGVEGDGRSRLNSCSSRHGSTVDVAEAGDISESEMVEENHWWPRMDEEVFMKLGRRR